MKFAIHIENHFNTTHPIFIPLKLNRVTIYLNVWKPTQEEYQDWDILKIELMVEAPSWDMSNSEFIGQEQSMFVYSGEFVSPNTPTRG